MFTLLEINSHHNIVGLPDRVPLRQPRKNAEMVSEWESQYRGTFESISCGWSVCNTVSNPPPHHHPTPPQASPTWKQCVALLIFMLPSLSVGVLYFVHILNGLEIFGLFGVARTQTRFCLSLIYNYLHIISSSLSLAQEMRRNKRRTVRSSSSKGLLRALPLHLSMSTWAYKFSAWLRWIINDCLC